MKGDSRRGGERKVRGRDTILRGRWMQRFRALLPEHPATPPPLPAPPSGVRAEVLELKIHYLCFCAERPVNIYARAPLPNAAKTGATFTHSFSTLAKLNIGKDDTIAD